VNVATMPPRAFDKTVRRQPLAFAAEAVYGNSLQSFQLLIMLVGPEYGSGGVQSNAPIGDSLPLAAFTPSFGEAKIGDSTGKS
jgi:hypothetical protein